MPVFLMFLLLKEVWFSRAEKGKNMILLTCARVFTICHKILNETTHNLNLLLNTKTGR